MNAPLSLADKLALALWDGLRAQRKRCEESDEQEASSASLKENEAAHATLIAIERAFEPYIGSSLQALGAVLMIQIKDGLSEDVTGLNRASLAAIRPQLVGAIAEDADRVLGCAPDPVVALVKQVRNEWDRLGEVINKAAEVETERPDEAEGILAPVQLALDAAMAELLKTPPTTLAGARDAIAWFAEYDKPNIPEMSGKYVQTLARSPIFALEGDCP